MVGFIILLFICLGIWVGFLGFADINEVKKNWPKYRCRPSVMPLASLYGHNTAENFNFCLSNMFNAELTSALGPVFAILGTVVSTLVTLIETANAIRVQMATMMGGVNTVFQNFADRFKQLISAVQMSAYRMKLIMGRLYGAFFAMIYMSIAGMTAVDNFTKTVLFDFLDTFCFDPDTVVDIEGKGPIKVKDVKIGDVFTKTKSQVTSTFQFEADGQPMVKLPGDIVVSTNHYVLSDGKWIQAGDHPEAIKVGPWAGGKERPLICFNTSDHHIPIGHLIFLDYDETEEGDQPTMSWIEKALNASKPLEKHLYDYTTCFHPLTKIKMQDGRMKSIQDIGLGEMLTTGEVIGVIQKQTLSFCEISSGERMAPGSLYWKDTQWVRAGDTHKVSSLPTPETYYSLVVMKTASLETEKGTFLRDYVEVHSPEAEQFYTQEIENLTVPVY